MSVLSSLTCISNLSGYDAASFLVHFLHFLCELVRWELRITFVEFLLKGQPQTDVHVSMSSSHPASSTWCQTLSLELYAVEATHNFLGISVTKMSCTFSFISSAFCSSSFAARRPSRGPGLSSFTSCRTLVASFPYFLGFASSVTLKPRWALYGEHPPHRSTPPKTSIFPTRPVPEWAFRVSHSPWHHCVLLSGPAFQDM